jgi:hypothetical protein
MTAPSWSHSRAPVFPEPASIGPYDKAVINDVRFQ